jgi:hypothetical protein
MTGPRYYWQKPSDLPERVELMDTVTSTPAAVITSVSRKWHWKRNTTVILHGAPPAEGKQSLLDDARQAVVDGLPDAPAGRPQTAYRKKPR